MLISLYLRRVHWIIPPLMLGVVAFASISGVSIIWPTNTDWLMHGDPATQWLGWQFFRQSPLLQWPMGANPAYGMEISTSIVFTDSIPVLAFLFKPLNAILPDAFQYLGLWVFICFVLQAVFAWKLLSYFLQDRWLLFIGSAFYTFAPVYLFRLHGHYALCGQWVLLAGLCLYFSKRYFLGRWIGLLALTSLINAYLLAMVGGIWLADLGQRYLLRSLKAKYLLIYITTSFVSTTAVMWFAGYFMVGSGASFWGFGYYRMNLIALSNPTVGWSLLFPDQPIGPGDYEGFNYLGLGMLGLALVFVYEFVRFPKLGIGRKVIIPLLALSFFLTTFAVSNHVALGERELFSYEIPRWLDRLVGVFRTSGRFFWPVYYLVFLVILVTTFSRLARRPAIFIGAVLLGVQIVDTSAGMARINSILSRPPVWSSPMQSALWSQIGDRYRKLIFVLPRNKPDDWMPLAQFAAAHRMSINIGYFSRADPVAENRARNQIATSVVSNELDTESLYVFEDNGLWKIAASRTDSPDVVGILDGFRIVAPKLKTLCSSCDKSLLTDIASDPPHDSSGMQRIFFGLQGMGQKYVAGGWSGPEQWGMWSDGDRATVAFDVSTAKRKDLDLVIEGHAFVVDVHPVQQIEVFANKRHLGALNYNMRSSEVQKIRIPEAAAFDNGKIVVIDFIFRNAISPAEVGLNSDIRRLGLGLISLQLTEGK